MQFMASPLLLALLRKDGFRHRILAFATAIAIGALLLGTVQDANAQAKTPNTAPAPKHSGNWDDLSPVQQKILEPLEEDWSYLSKERRQKWIQVANVYPKMKRADQERLQSRMNEWAKLSQKDRRIARDNYLSSLRFPAEEKASAWQAYQQLSPEEKKKLAAKEDSKKKPTAANSPTLQSRPTSPAPVTPAAAPKKGDGA
jgi:hypothetical protein